MKRFEKYVKIAELTNDASNFASKAALRIIGYSTTPELEVKKVLELCEKYHTTYISARGSQLYAGTKAINLADSGEFEGSIITDLSTPKESRRKMSTNDWVEMVISVLGNDFPETITISRERVSALHSRKGCGEHKIIEVSEHYAYYYRYYVWERDSNGIERTMEIPTEVLLDRYTNTSIIEELEFSTENMGHYGNNSDVYREVAELPLTNALEFKKENGVPAMTLSMPNGIYLPIEHLTKHTCYVYAFGRRLERPWKEGEDYYKKCYNSMEAQLENQTLHYFTEAIISDGLYI